MTYGSLFAGIGGFDLGFDRAGLTCAWQVERNEFCRQVLAKHWPNVRRHDDVCTFPPGPVEDWRVDVICGGFPCQDLSHAGKRAGLRGQQSGLFFELARIVGVLAPRFVVLENVAALLTRGMGDVLGTLAEIGYDAEWQVTGCDDIGGSQRRKRLWILAYPNHPRRERPIWAGQSYAEREARTIARRESLRSACGHWPPGPRAVTNIPRMADGSTNRMDRLRALGNAVVPQIAEWIGRAILEHARTVPGAAKGGEA